MCERICLIFFSVYYRLWLVFYLDVLEKVKERLAGPKYSFIDSVLMLFHPESSWLWKTWQRVEYLLSAGSLDSADTTAHELLPLLEKCQDAGGSWQWILARCERPGPLLVSHHLCMPGAWQPEQTKALDKPDVVSSGSEGLSGQDEFRMSSGKMCRSGVQFLQVSPGVWGTARTPQGIRNAVRYLWLPSKGVLKDLLPGTWPECFIFQLTVEKGKYTAQKCQYLKVKMDCRIHV